MLPETRNGPVPPDQAAANITTRHQHAEGVNPMMPPAIGHDQPLPAIACSDCSATGDPATLQFTHDDGCPVGRGLDEMTADDRRFFADHPAAPHRVRAITWAEVQQLKDHGAYPSDLDMAGWRVLVSQPFGPGVRTRRFLPPRGSA